MRADIGSDIWLAIAGSCDGDVGGTEGGGFKLLVPPGVEMTVAGNAADGSVKKAKPEGSGCQVGNRASTGARAGRRDHCSVDDASYVNEIFSMVSGDREMRHNTAEARMGANDWARESSMSTFWVNISNTQMINRISIVVSQEYIAAHASEELSPWRNAGNVA